MPPLSRRTLLAALAGGAGCGRAVRFIGGSVYVANRDSQSIAALDLGRLTVTRRAALDASPTELFSHPDQAVLYAFAPADSILFVLDLPDLTIRRRVRLGAPALSARLSADGAWLAVLRAEAPALILLDTASWQHHAIALPALPQGLAIHGAMAAVTLPELAEAALLDLSARRVEARVPTGAAPGVVGFRPDGRVVVAGNRADRTLTLIDVASRSVVAHLPLALEPEHFCFKADGGILYVTGRGLDAVSVVYPYRHIVAETLLAGRTPGAMAVTTSTPEFLFVANAESGDVTILRVRSSRVAAVVAVGAEPGHIAITPDNQYALVLNRRSGDVAVIDVAALDERRGRPAPPPLFTMIPVGLSPVSAAFHA